MGAKMRRHPRKLPPMTDEEIREFLKFFDALFDEDGESTEEN